MHHAYSPRHLPRDVGSGGGTLLAAPIRGTRSAATDAIAVHVKGKVWLKEAPTEQPSELNWSSLAPCCSLPAARSTHVEQGARALARARAPRFSVGRRSRRPTPGASFAPAAPARRCAHTRTIRPRVSYYNLGWRADAGPRRIAGRGWLRIAVCSAALVQVRSAGAVLGRAGCCGLRSLRSLVVEVQPAGWPTTRAARCGRPSPLQMPASTRPGSPLPCSSRSTT